MQNNHEALETWTEDELVRAAQAGRHDAFEALMKHTFSNCLKLALSILKERQEAEDQVQNAYWKAFQHLGQFQHDAKFSTWMTRIVVNQCLMRLRQAKRATFFYLDDALIGESRGTFELVDQAASPEQRLGSQELAGLLKHEIARVPALLRHVLILRDMDQLPMPEVATRLGISVAAAKSRLLRARLELRQRLERHCGPRGHATLTA